MRAASPAASAGARRIAAQPGIDDAMTHATLAADAAASTSAADALAPADADHLGWLESEAIHILREVAGQCAHPALLFSGGKDSLVLLRLAEKAFRPARFPFPLLHIDTGHNFPEVIAFRDARAAELGERLIVRSVEDSIAQRPRRAAPPDESRNAHQSVTLLDAIAEFGFDACIGGARRDEEKARAKERVFSFRDEFGQWDPQEPAPRALEPVQRPRAPGRARARVPDQQLDRARRVAVHRARAARRAVDLLRAHAARSCAAAARWCR